jgi:surface antigen
MNPALLITFSGSLKKQFLIAVVALLVITSLPVVAVFSFGHNALQYLSGSDSETAYAISTDVQGFYEGPEVAGDAYAWGNCTYWAAALKMKDGHPVPNTWGNANTWDDNAIHDGYSVDHDPTVGAVFQTDEGDLGHVAYVSEVNPASGEWKISEMNVKGLNVVSTRTFAAVSAKYFNFIHGKIGENQWNQPITSLP